MRSGRGVSGCPLVMLPGVYGAFGLAHSLLRYGLVIAFQYIYASVKAFSRLPKTYLYSINVEIEIKFQHNSARV